ncbi:hypothetical protein C0995_000055 [Termitomyces sp. Mi166|nr:hypothetical protein C0995_000055 [Termitomyces sp. Mi166\
MNARPLYRLYIGYLTIAQVVSYDPVPRWGQATILINNALFVHGGKTDPYNSYGYTSAPNNNDVLYLSLSSSFSTSSPPWQLLSNASSHSSSAMGPAISWHTLSAFDIAHLFLFGGEPDPNSSTVLTGLADSAYLVDLGNQLAPSWTSEPVAWAGEPVRRIHHSATITNTGNVYIIGGEKADDSGIVFSENYIFDPSRPSFTLAPSDNAPQSITGHASVVLPDGRILVFGGYSQASGGLLPFSTIWSLNSSQPSPFWSTTSVSNLSLPSPRRAFAATTISNGKVLIHGGSDAVLQTNFEDGWILDPTQDPMIWTQVEALSQLGALRDHFAVSSGDQVIFSFGARLLLSVLIIELKYLFEGYGNNKPSPAVMRIFNTNTGAFETVFTPPSSYPSSQTQTVPSPSQTSKQLRPTGSSVGHRSSVALPTKTTGPNSDDPNSPGEGGADVSNQDSNHNIIRIVVGSVLGLLSVVLVAVAVTYYIRRRRRHARGGWHFRALGGPNDHHDDESEHLAGSIPTAGSYPRRIFRNHHGWSFGLCDTTGLAATFGFGTRTPRFVPERKDMLADEDTRDFTPWHSDKGREDTLDHTWSLRSLIPSLKRSREPSLAGSMGNMSWREKSDVFADDVALIREEEANPSHARTPRLHERGEQSYTTQKSHHDPFADPIGEDVYDGHDEHDHITNQPYLHPIPKQLSTLRMILPISQDKHPLGPLAENLSEHTTHTTLNETYNSVSVSSHATSLHNPADAVSSITLYTSFDLPPTSLLPSSSTVGASALVKRSDSWWSRFAKTSFLDRRPSSTSKRTFDFRDPNPPPHLDAIEENVRTASIDRQRSDSSEPGPSTEVMRHLPMLQGGYHKSQSSVRTADTEAIEKMARTMDVAQMMRSDSRRTASTSTINLSTDTRLSVWLHEGTLSKASRPRSG